jgi:hypothetical protein
MQIDISIPENLNEITVEQYQKYNKLVSNNEASEFVNQKTIEIFCNIDLKDVANISFKSTREILTHLNEVFNVKHNLIPTFKINGIEFGFEPNLEEIKSGVYIDAETYLGSIDTLHKAMAVLYRPIKKRTKDLYTIKDYNSAKDFENVMLKAPINVALGMQVFFCNLAIELANATSLYLQEGKIITQEQKQILEENGVGINQFTGLLKEMSSDLMRSLNYQFTNY